MFHTSQSKIHSNIDFSGAIMPSNPIVMESNKAIRITWERRVNAYEDSDIEEFVSAHCGGQACAIVGRFQGACNYCFRMRFEDGKE
jgi:hypothetical protein